MTDHVAQPWLSPGGRAHLGHVRGTAGLSRPARPAPKASQSSLTLTQSAGPLVLTQKPEPRRHGGLRPVTGQRPAWGQEAKRACPVQRSHFRLSLTSGCPLLLAVPYFHPITGGSHGESLGRSIPHSAFSTTDADSG